MIFFILISLTNFITLQYLFANYGIAHFFSLNKERPNLAKLKRAIIFHEITECLSFFIRWNHEANEIFWNFFLSSKATNTHQNKPNGRRNRNKIQTTHVQRLLQTDIRFEKRKKRSENRNKRMVERCVQHSHRYTYERAACTRARGITSDLCV